MRAERTVQPAAERSGTSLRVNAPDDVFEREADRAADAGRAVRPSDVLSAARSEYSKLDKSLADAEVRDWV